MSSHVRTGPAEDEDDDGPVTMFDVVPPDEYDDGKPATDEDWQWYRDLRAAVAEALVALVNAYRNRSGSQPGWNLSHRTTSVIVRHCRAISQDYLSGDPDAAGVRQVLYDLAAAHGFLVVGRLFGQHVARLGDNTDPLDFDGALELVEDALRFGLPGRSDRR